MKRKVLIFILLSLTIILASSIVLAKTIELDMVSFDDNTHKYYYELLEESLKLTGNELVINNLGYIPNQRIEKMLDTGIVSIHWFVESDKRDRRWVPIREGLTNGLIGNRILFIPKGMQSDYLNVKTLDDFRSLDKVGGFGVGWYDVKVWKKNNLKYYEKDGEWRSLYPMVAANNRGIDYFSRGVIEILSEAKQYPQLDIEENLVFIYSRDFYFYLSPVAEQYKEIIKKSLLKAKETGLMDKLINKYWGNTLEELEYDNRIKIRLENP